MLTVTAQKPAFSIVIPTLNEAKYLPKLLGDLAQQTFTDFEVIVCDGESEDETVNRAGAFAPKLSLTILSSQKRNVGSQRNLGAKNAKSDWLIFMDADNRLPKHFMQGIRYQLDKSPEVDVFSCWIDTKSYEPNDQPLIDLFNIGMELYTKVSPWALGSMLGVRRKLFNKIKFDETLAMSEDIEFFRSYKQHGFHFKHWRDPQYIVSLRRFKKEGTLKMMRAYATAQILFLAGKKITDPLKNYPMQGGSYYEQKSVSRFESLKRLFAKASKDQLALAKKIVTSALWTDPELLN